LIPKEAKEGWSDFVVGIMAEASALVDTNPQHKHYMNGQTPIFPELNSLNKNIFHIRTCKSSLF